MYGVCVVCDVGRRHAVAFRAKRRRHRVFVFQVVFMCVCTALCVRARYHQLPSSQVASPCMSYVSCAPSAIHHMPRRRVVVRVRAFEP